MPVQIEFNPAALAWYEKAGWEAYYRRDWLRVGHLLVLVNHREFGLTWPAAVLAALHTVRASIAFAPTDNDLLATRRHLERYYGLVRRGSRIQASAATLAALELQYWVVHRQLASQRKPAHAAAAAEPLAQALAKLHAALFDSTPDAMHASACFRTLAALAVDRITSNRSANLAADWQRVEHYLQEAYRAVRHMAERQT